MSVYGYRITAKTTNTSTGEKAHVYECLGPGPHYRADDRAVANWERKLDTGRKRGAQIEHTGLYVEDDHHGAAVYRGVKSLYADSMTYEIAYDASGNPITVHNPRKPMTEQMRRMMSMD